MHFGNMKFKQKAREEQADVDSTEGIKKSPPHSLSGFFTLYMYKPPCPTGLVLYPFTSFSLSLLTFFTKPALSFWCPNPNFSNYT